MDPPEIEPRSADVSLGHLVGRLRFRQLSLLATIGEYRNMHRAAAAVHMAQPSATKMLRDVERVFGFPLFERLPRGMRPTELGTEVLAFAQRALGDLARLSQDLQHQRTGGSGKLVIGTIPGAAPGPVVRAVVDLTRKHPRIAVKLFADKDQDLVPLLLERTIDFAIAPFVEPARRSTQLNYMTLDSKVVCLVCRPGHPVSGVRDLQPAALKRWTWILPPPSSAARQSIEQDFAAADTEMPPAVIESACSATALQLVQQSDAIAALPESAITDHLQAGLVVRLPVTLHQAQPSLFLLWRRDDRSTRVQAFLDMLGRHTADPEESIEPERSKHRTHQRKGASIQRLERHPDPGADS
jgi:DNA-binding transcriptional LysR family regulator